MESVIHGVIATKLEAKLPAFVHRSKLTYFGNSGGYTTGMSTGPAWWFIGSEAGYWMWRSANSAASGPLRTLEDAKADAARFGFDAAEHYWTATTEGRTSHFRPGQPSVNLPAGENPKD